MKIAVYTTKDGKETVKPIEGETYVELSDKLEEMFPDFQYGNHISVYEDETRNDVVMWSSVEPDYKELFFEWAADYRFGIED